MDTVTNSIISLNCIIVNNQLRVLTPPFQLKVPRQWDCRVILAYLRIAAPSLRDKDPKSFSIHKPLSTISSDLTELNNTQVNLQTPVLTYTLACVEDEFPLMREDASHVDTIICVNDMGQGTLSTH